MLIITFNNEPHYVKIKKDDARVPQELSNFKYVTQTQIL